MPVSGPQLSDDDLQRATSTIQQLRSALAAKIVGQTTLRRRVAADRTDRVGAHPSRERPWPGQDDRRQDARGEPRRTLSAHPVHTGPVAKRYHRGEDWDQKNGEFKVSFGPVHANVVLLDEINRSSAKTQSAMLEAMEEHQTAISERLSAPQPVPGAGHPEPDRPRGHLSAVGSPRWTDSC